jgi:hypothetical protein
MVAMNVSDCHLCLGFRTGAKTGKPAARLSSPKSARPTAMDAAIQPVLKVLPLTPLIDAPRSVMLGGSSLSSQAARIAIMAAWGILSSFAIALKLFRSQRFFETKRPQADV